MRKLVALCVIALTATAANAAIEHSWTNAPTGAGNIRNDLHIVSDPCWTNSHIEVDTTPSQIHFGAGSAPHIDNTIPGFADDMGCFPGSASVAYHTESATYTETDWGVAGGSCSVDPIYTVTCSPDANGSVLVTSYNLNAEARTDTWPIVNGAVVPEPASLSLLAIGGVAALIRRRR